MSTRRDSAEELQRARMALAEAGYSPDCAYLHHTHDEVWFVTYDANGPYVPHDVACKVADVCGFPPPWAGPSLTGGHR